MVSGYEERRAGEKSSVPLTYTCTRNHAHIHYRRRYRKGKPEGSRCLACDRMSKETKDIYKVDNAPLRNAVLREMERDPFLTWHELCVRSGIVRCGKADTSHMQRLLGLKPWVCNKSKNPNSFSTEIKEEQAIKIAAAVHKDPWELGF